MAYPMSWPRLMQIYGLEDGSWQEWRGDMAPLVGKIARDLQRLRSDQFDEMHLRSYAAIGGVTVHQVELILAAFFAGRAGKGDG